MFGKMCLNVREVLEVINDPVKLQRLLDMRFNEYHWGIDYIARKLKIERGTVSTILQLLNLPPRLQGTYKEDYDRVRALIVEEGYYPSKIHRETHLSTPFIMAIDVALWLLEDEGFLERFKAVWSDQKTFKQIREELNHPSVWGVNSNPIIKLIAHDLGLRPLWSREKIEATIDPANLTKVIGVLKDQVQKIQQATCQLAQIVNQVDKIE